MKGMYIRLCMWELRHEFQYELHLISSFKLTREGNKKWFCVCRVVMTLVVSTRLTDILSQRMFQHMDRFRRRRNVTEMKTRRRRRMKACGKLHSDETECSVSCFTRQIVSWRCNKTDNFRFSFSSSLVITRDSPQGLNCPPDRVQGCSSF